MAEVGPPSQGMAPGSGKGPPTEGGTPPNPTLTLTQP